ncbi:MmcQ/YjbR family DNA-binding protein [Carboxylicivirga linearis]|uniref:MmcQ/YjbR family DNA-binding protein n=1 Tax=Carboxylicivirga linearis TaxID=1628157 RepID=A0ABS5JTJ6_9BACT|nr:MmcQ/YjbR family DNA-binding protein [Carboxylicivirga linearis]MBS2098188.1 MmcQ/YjbR family DNA-binding protein [Carboxylicivirga linearis]
MNIEEFREFCLQKAMVTEEFPFDETTLVFKVAGKMFALTDVEDDFYINLKCDPEKAIELREQYSSVLPGYHMSKKHWNTVRVDGSVKDEILCEWINDSYSLVVKGLPKKVRDQLNG